MRRKVASPNVFSKKKGRGLRRIPFMVRMGLNSLTMLKGNFRSRKRKVRVDHVKWGTEPPIRHGGRYIIGFGASLGLLMQGQTQARHLEATFRDNTRSVTGTNELIGSW